MDNAEYYVINGYSDEGYCFSGPPFESGEGTKDWQDLGNTDIGVLEVYSVKPGRIAEDIKTVKDSFEFVLTHASNPKEWIYPAYKSGLEGFENWIKALEKVTAVKIGMAYNAACWSECRGFGIRFLKEARERINGKTSTLFDEATKNYESVYENLKKVSELFPLQSNLTMDTITDSELINRAINYLTDARKAEEAGLSSLEKIYNEI